MLVTNDKTTIISFGDDKSICFWDSNTGALLRKRWLDMGQGEAGRIIDTDLGLRTNLLAIARINAAGKPVVQLLDIRQDKIVGTFEGFSQDLGFVRIDPAEKFILTCSAQFGNYNSEGIRLWKIPPRTGKPFSVDKASAQVAGAYVHDLCFYDQGRKVLLTAYYKESVGVEITHNPQAIPEYTLKRISPLIKDKGHVKFLPEENKILFGDHTGAVSKVDLSGKGEVLINPGGWKSTKALDSTVMEIFVSSSRKKAMITGAVGENETRRDFFELFDVESRKVIQRKSGWFQFVHFLSDSVLVGVGEHGLFRWNFANDKLAIFSRNYDAFDNDEIQFGAPAKIAFDSLRSVIDFQQLQLEPSDGAPGYSARKTLYQGSQLTLNHNSRAVRINGDMHYFFPPDEEITAYSFINNGKIVLGKRGYRNNRTSLLLYDRQSNTRGLVTEPALAFEGSLGSIQSIAPAPIELGSLFATRDRFGVISLWKEDSDEFYYQFRNRNHYWMFVNFNLDVFRSDNYVYTLPQNGYKGKLKSREKVVGFNDFTLRTKAEMVPYLETLDPEKPVTIKVDRKGEIVTDQLMLSKLKYVSPLLSFTRIEDGEWICWTPQGYYAASAGGEKSAGWVINKGPNEFAEFHPMYDFKKQFYRPELIKLIATEGSFRKAVELYNATAEQPIGASGSLSQKLPPSIMWVSPVAPDTLLSKNTIRLTARVSSSTSLQAAKILLNGRTVLRRDQVSIRQEKGGAGNYEVSFDIDLPSLENTINIFAENENGSTVSQERVLRLKQLETGIEKYKPNLYLLSVGVSGHTQPAYSLNYADKDANAIAEMYAAQQGLLFRNVFSRTLVNEQASRSNILEAFYWLEQNATQKDVVIIFIASHGLNEKDKFYILPHDGDPERIRITGVDWLNFSDVLGNLPSKVLVFIDACHSGKLGANLLAKRGETDLMEAVRALAREENGVVIMAASTGREFSFESDEWRHGAFTLALLEGMGDGKADLNEDGIINIREIDYYVAERVKVLTNGRQHPTTQKPSVVSEFPLVQVRSNRR